MFLLTDWTSVSQESLCLSKIYKDGCCTCDQGYFAAAGATECSACAIGTYDHDVNASVHASPPRNPAASPCVPCPAGKVSGAEARDYCDLCESGPSTPSPGGVCPFAPRSLQRALLNAARPNGLLSPLR